MDSVTAQKHVLHISIQTLCKTAIIRKKNQNAYCFCHALKMVLHSATYACLITNTYTRRERKRKSRKRINGWVKEKLWKKVHGTKRVFVSKYNYRRHYIFSFFSVHRNILSSHYSSAHINSTRIPLNIINKVTII